MERIFRNAFIITKKLTSSAILKANNFKVISRQMNNPTRIKSEEEIKEMISLKIKEYENLISFQSPERLKICQEVNLLDSKLRKSFGFSEDEDLTIFPTFKFDEPKIDNQLD
jgi:hypothetical protein|uniref:ATP synthase-coupling factor 6, mitochondrial n=1 Tax=Sipha flava TaxID=143950 RepID=A0A2S2QYJ3_9HEMI